MLQDDVRIVRVEPRQFHGGLRDKVRMINEILINRRVFRDIDDDGAASLSADTARLLPEGGHRARMAGKDAEVEIADVDAELQRVRRDDRIDDAVEEIMFEFAAFGREEAAAVWFDAIRQRGVFAVRHGTIEPFDLLPPAAEADRADAELRRFADERDGNGGGAFAVVSAVFSREQRRVDAEQFSLRTRRSVLLNDVEVTSEQRFHVFGGIADRRGAGDERRSYMIQIADAEQTAEDVCDMRAETAAIRMDFVNDDVAKT